jgi:hypothetical protein
VATFTTSQSYSDALRLVDRQLESTPNDPVALANKGNLCVLTGNFSNAIPPLTLSLSLTNTYAARLNRALTCAASSTGGRAQKQFLISISNWLAALASSAIGNLWPLL